jgi:hypothetical protein
MKLTRLRIDQFRRFRQPFELRDLTDGLNLFTGPNEAGKSTLVAAIRAAFFERHRSGTVEHLRPWGDGSAAPEVELDFELGGTPCRLTKRFLVRKRCTLQFGTRTLDGTDAEDFIAEQLGFAFAAKGSSKSEHWGIPGLLWMEQGEAQHIREAVTHATDHLRTALNASLGEIAGGDGDDVTNEVEKLRNELLTPTSDKPRGVHAEALQTEQSLRDALAAVDADLLIYRQKVDRLALLRREHETDTGERPWEALRAQAKAAGDALREAQSLQQQLDGERNAALALAQRIDLLRRQLDGHAAESLDAGRRADAVVAAQRTLDDANSLAAPWQQRERDAILQHDTARRTLALARAQDNRRALLRELDDLRRKAGVTSAALAQAEAEQSRQLALRAEAAASEISATDVAALREQARRIRELDIRRSAIATRLRFALDAGRELRIGDETVAGEGERQLPEATTLTLPGYGRLCIEPGGSDIAALARDAAELHDRHTSALSRLGLASFDAAEARQQLHALKLSDLKAAAATLKALAPAGIDALRAEGAALDARTGEVQQRLDAHTDDGGDTLPSVSEAESAEDLARRSAAEAARQLAAARNGCAAAQAALEAAQRERDAARARLDDPARARQVADANISLTDALAQHAAAVQRIEYLAGRLDAVRPQTLAQDVERYTRSAEQLEKTFALRRDALTVLEVELQAAGAQGLDERRAELARDHAAAARRADQLVRRARALDLLLKLLQDKRHALTQRLQAPLQRHLNHALGLLFPGARIAIDDSLSPGPLTREGTDGSESGPVDELSFGAREQMGVIARLAYADLLKEAGKPTLVILDDALVHSDESRLAQMKRVLFDAATRHQILLFTCHPEKWRDMGVVPRDLA